MALTLPRGPLSGDPGPVNYRIEGPDHLLYLDDFPRRVRAVLGGETVLDTRRGRLLHETGLLPQLYVPAEDLRGDLLRPTDRTTYCPYKGDASHWSVLVGGRAAENAVWAYEAPIDSAGWLRGLYGVHFESMDTWLDEDEVVEGHLRDPFHRVDVRHCEQPVRVSAGSHLVAESDEVEVLSETGLPNRFYLPRDAVDDALLVPSDTAAVCPYKGTSRYWSLLADGDTLEDAVWAYDDPLDPARQVAGRLCFLHDALTIDLDGEPVS